MTLKKLLLFLTLPLYLLDQATKFWTIGHFAPPPSGGFGTFDPPVVVLDGIFNLTRVHNQGVAFGFGNGSQWAPVVFLFVPVIALVLIRIFWKKGAFNHPLSKIAVALLLCGISGNLTDRLAQGFLLQEFRAASFMERLSHGYVVDFLDFTIPLIRYHWPAFNVADSCICVAAFLLFIGGIRDEAKCRKPEDKSGA